MSDCFIFAIICWRDESKKIVIPTTNHSENEDFTSYLAQKRDHKSMAGKRLLDTGEGELYHHHHLPPCAIPWHSCPNLVTEIENRDPFAMEYI